MKPEYTTEEGHIFSHEDVVEYVKWKIANGENINDIINFDESEIWQHVAHRQIMKKFNKLGN